MTELEALRAVAEAACKHSRQIALSGKSRGDERQELDDALAALAAAEPDGWRPNQDNRTISEMAMLVRRLIHRTRKYEESDPVAMQATDYLRRKGLTGSPLRDDALPPPPAPDGWRPDRPGWYWVRYNA